MEQVLMTLMAKMDAMEARLAPVAPVAPVAPRKIHCSLCGTEGHMKTGCPNKKTIIVAPPPLPVAPPPPAPESVVSDSSFMSSVSTHRSPINSYGIPIEPDVKCIGWFDKMMTKMDCDYQTSDLGMWYMMKTAYALDKTKFQIIGGLHTNPEGTKTYYSVKHTLIDDKIATIHVYGASRFVEKFIVNQMEYMILGQKYTFNFTYKKKFIRGGWNGM
jgi:hypothetical protein